MSTYGAGVVEPRGRVAVHGRRRVEVHAAQNGGIGKVSVLYQHVDVKVVARLVHVSVIHVGTGEIRRRRTVVSDPL